MSKAWQLYPHRSDDLIEQLLFNRGLKTKTEIESFLNPDLKNYDKDLQVPGVSTAKKRILEAIEKRELIIVYGDYDVDGVCGASVLYLGLTAAGAKVLPYIPHREKEGYGVSKVGLQNAKDQGAGLVITVDNGIVALDSAKFAKELNLDLIITDHHLPLEEKPEALAVVHTTGMCGAAVAWCLVRSLIEEGEANELLDLVAMATIADMVPLVGVNRSLVKIGLKKLSMTKRAGLKALMAESSLLGEEITPYHIGHILGPRLNAKGRLGHALDAVRLLCTKDLVKAATLAKDLEAANNQRKLLVAEAVSSAKLSVQTVEGNIIIIDSDEWIPGVLGLIAGKISEEYGLPTIAISRGESVSKGSARSARGINIVETIRGFSDLLIDVGGHPQAAGFTLETIKIEEFRSKLIDTMKSVDLSGEVSLMIDAEMSITRLSKSLANKLNEFEPTGVGNPKPLLASYGATLSDLKIVGNGKHLKGKADGIDFIAFGMGDIKDLLKGPVNLAYYLEIDRFNGSEKLQLKVIDIQL